jgi:hypothetical protein
LNPILKAWLSWAASHLLAVLGVGGLIYGLLVGEHVRALRAEADKTAAALVAVEAVKRGAVEGQLVARIALDAQQTELLKALQKIDGRVKAVEQSKTAITIEDKPVGHVDNPAAPTVWLENNHRFGLNLKTFEFWRKQEFGFEADVIAGPAGQRIENLAFHEYDPATHEEIKLEGVALKTDFRFVKEVGPVANPWHLRLAALGGTMGFGAGIQVNPWRGLLLTAGAAYKSGDPRGLVGLGWRLRFPWFDSTLGVNVLGTYGKTGFRGDAAGSVEVTR